MNKQLFFLLFLTLGALSLKSQEQIAKNRPWGFYAIQWTFSEDLVGVKRVDIPIEIHQDVPDEYQLYVQIGQGSTLEGRGFYGGIQTNLMNKGNGALFSRWAQNDGKPNAEQLSLKDITDYEFYEIDDYEGSFCSVRRKLKFDKGKYLFSYIREKSWVRLEVNGILVGKINFKANSWNLEPYLIAFLEIYGGGNNRNGFIESNEIPPIDITYTRPVVYFGNGRPKKPKQAFVNDYGKNDMNQKIASICRTQKLKDGFRVRVDWKNLKYYDGEAGKWETFDE